LDTKETNKKAETRLTQGKEQKEKEKKKRNRKKG
jgi:hypothetical protein